MKNYKYNILWVDDIWKDFDINSDETKVKRMIEIFENVLSLSNGGAYKLDVKLKDNIPVGYTELSENQKADYRLLILDFEFGGNSDEYDLHTLLKLARNKKIPYLIFTNFPNDITLRTVLKDNDPLNLGILQKDVDGSNRLVSTINSFFQNIPFRILQISDLHCNSAADDLNMRHSQTKMFDSLYLKLRDIVRNTPIDLLFFTGDFASRNPQKELIDVNKVLRKIIDVSIANNDDMDRVFMIPGNHDLVWENFANKQISNAPWSHYITLYSTLFRTNIEILKSTKSWDNENKTIDPYSNSDDLFWNRRFPELNLNIIGLSSTSTDPQIQGKGYFSENITKKIDECWGETQPNEIKIALIHHNLFTVITPNPNDEKNIVDKAGLAIHSLIKHNCRLIFSGHTHMGTFLKLSIANQNIDGFDDLSEISCISNGTVGGLSPNFDRARSFNIIDIHHKDDLSNKRGVTIKPFYYDSTRNIWVDRKSISTEL